MDKESTIKKLMETEVNLKETLDKLGSDNEKDLDSALKMDLGMYGRRYKNTLLELTPEECVEIKQYADQQGITLEYFDEYCPTAEEWKRAKEDDKAESSLEELCRKYPEKEARLRAVEEAAKADCKPLLDKLEPKKKKGLLGLFGKE